MNQNYEAIVTMIKELGKAITSKISQAPYDATYEGTILKVLPSNTYLVLVAGKEYKITTKNNTYFKECQQVNVHIPQNNWKKIRILEDINADDTSASSVTSINGKTGDVELEIGDISDLSNNLNNLMPKCLRYTKNATKDEVLNISVPNISSTVHAINVLIYNKTALENAIYGIDYAYRFTDNSTLQIDFLSSGNYTIDYFYFEKVVITNINL